MMNYRQTIKKYSVPLLLIAGISFSFGWIASNISEDKPVTKEMIAYAEKLIGLNFTDAKRDSMVDGLNDQLRNLNNIRKYELSNDVTPALLFNPIPAGFSFDAKQKSLVFSDYSKTMPPKNREDLAYYSVGELAYLIKNRKISCEELTKFFIERLKKYGPGLKCVITLTDDYAIQQARILDKELAQGKYRGPLHGIPYGLKDLFAVKGYLTTWGAPPYKNQILDTTATIVKKLEKAGAILTAKTSLGELAMDDVWFDGMTRNPWDITQGSSGSSAGSASSVSAGLLPFAIGTETWGSIVSPSTVCGVTGLRPTFGRISRAGAMALSWSMDKVGPICRNAEDCAIVFNSIRGSDGLDLTVTDKAFNYTPKIDVKKLRVGYLASDFTRVYDFHSNDSVALDKLRSLGVQLIPVALPADIPVEDLAIILTAEAGASFDNLTRNGGDDQMVRQMKYSWPNIFRTSRFIPAVEYINGNRIRQKLIVEMNVLMKKYDVLVVPSLEGNALLLTNLSGHPSITVPSGFSEKGTPTSITFLGNLYDEGTIIAFAKYYQDMTGYHLKRPKSFK